MRIKPNRANLDQRERSAANWRKWNELRHWDLRCPACEHEGTVYITLKKLRASNLKCSVCGGYLWRNSATNQ